MASVSARRAPESRTSTKIPNATTRTRRTSPPRIRKSMAAQLEELKQAEMDSAVGSPSADLAAQQDDRSSSLSEPDDDIDELDEPNGVSDGLTSLKPLPVQRSLEVDSDAETERLEHTPQRLRKHAESLAITPSKLSQAATADDELSEPPSPLPAGTGAASSTSTIATAGKLQPSQAQASHEIRKRDVIEEVAAGLKRKRSDTADSSLTSAESDLGESPRKRSHEETADDQLRREDAIDDNELAAENAARADGTPMLDEIRDTPPIAPKGPKGRRGRQKGKKHNQAVDDGAVEQKEEDVAVGPPEEAAEEDPVKLEEERKLKQQAGELYDGLAKTFRSFREKLYNERIAAMDAELLLLSQPDCAHPEYLRQVACVETRHQKQNRECEAHYNYKLRSIRQHTLGERSQLHSQYFQSVRSLRETMLYNLGEEWYAIQKERRQGHQAELDDAQVYKYDPRRGEQLKRQAKYNLEVSVLSGTAKYVGFPAAPEMTGVEDERRDEDMKQMKISKVAAAQSSVQPQALSAAAHVQAQKERLAHEQYLEQNPWARPQAPIHVHGTPGISHTPDWAHSAASKHVRHTQHLGQQRNSSPFMTPLPPRTSQHPHAEQQQPSSGAATVGINSDEMGSSEAPIPSSVLAAPPTLDRMAHLHHQHHTLGGGGGGSNQTSPLAFPSKLRQDGPGTTTAPGGYRNISGLSSTSTIDAPPPDHTHYQPQQHQHQYQYHPQHQHPPVLGEDTTPSKPSLPLEASTGPQAFPTSQLHLHLGDERRDVYASVGFRPQAGAFGTPGPFHGPPSTTGAGA